jgi:repressor LexA
MYLTKKQKAVYDYVKEYIDKNGFAPSVQEMCNFFGKASLNTMHKYLVTLEEKGLLKRTPYKNRSIELVEDPFNQHSIFDIPVLGYITDGLPILPSDSVKFMKVPEILMRGKHTYLLIVKGNYLVGECIMDGDFVLVESKNVADNGDLVIMRSSAENVTVRKVFKKKEYTMLQLNAPGMEPEIISNDTDLEVNGVIIGVFRNYKPVLSD